MVWLFWSWCFLTSFPIAMSGVTRLLVFHLYSERHWRNKSDIEVLQGIFYSFLSSQADFFLPSPKAASLPHLLLQPLPGIEDLSLSFFKLYALSPDKCASLWENYPLDIEIAGKKKPLSAGFPAAFQFSTPTPWVVIGFSYIMVFVPHSKFVSCFFSSFLFLFYCF